MKIFGHDCKDELKDNNLKVTPARISVMRYLENTQNPADAEMIVGQLKNEGISADPATVYRILDIFYKKGIIQKIELGEGKYRYERSKNHHHHLLCTNCGRVEDVEGDFISKMQNDIREKTGFLVKNHSLEFFGLCPDCQK
ncbi:MAG TPA: Fur family transcriptional regulator [Candidatus Sulfotelmatobacter sp.]|nr:Fur family transcriptional regulator [Candidatus Sulfotelmatobacter sp.]